MVTSSSRRTTRAARTAASQRGREQKKRKLDDAPAKKWFRVRRAPSQDCGFLVWTWKPFEDLTKEERQLINRKQENDLATPSVKTNSSMPTADESFLSDSVHQTPGSHAMLSTPSEDALLSLGKSTDESTTPMLGSQAESDTACAEPPAKRARYDHDSILNDATTLLSLPQQQHQEPVASFRGSSQPLASVEQEQDASKTTPMETTLLLPESNETKTQTAMEKEPAPFPLEATNQAVTINAPMQVEQGPVDSDLIYATAEQSIVPNADEEQLQTALQAKKQTNFELEDQLTNENSALASPSTDSTHPNESTLNQPHATTIPSQMEYTGTEEQSTGAEQSAAVKQHIAENEAVAALSSLADIFASEPNAPEN